MPGNSRVNNGGAFGDGLFLRQGPDAYPERLTSVKVAVLAPKNNAQRTLQAGALEFAGRLREWTDALLQMMERSGGTAGRG